MKTTKLSFDFSDHAQLVELLRMEAARSKRTQKAILVAALQSYFAERLENTLLHRAAEKAFAEWDNPEDEVYDSL